jgi:hypothetical protein
MALTDFAEVALLNRIFHGTALPSRSFYLGLLTAAPLDDGTVTEVSSSGTAYARRSIAFAAASGGVSNNSATLTFPTATAAWGTITYVGIFDAASGGNLWFYAPLTTSQTVGIGNVFTAPAGSFPVQFTGGRATYYLADQILDEALRGDSWTPPASLYLGAYVTATDASGGGTEVAYSGYARQAVALSVASGAGGQVANTARVTFPAPASGTYAITHVGLLDASTAGNMLWQGALAATVTVLPNGTLYFLPGDYAVGVN